LCSHNNTSSRDHRLYEASRPQHRRLRDFRSHSRPDHPDGAVFILNTSVHRTAARLVDILPVDRRLVSDNDLQWQAQLLANFSGIYLSPAARSPCFDADCNRMQPNILALRAEVSDLKLQNSVLTSENKRLESELQTENKRRDERIKLLSSSFNYRDSSSHFPRPASTGFNNAVAGPSRSNHYKVVPKAQKQQEIGKKIDTCLREKTGPRRLSGSNLMSNLYGRARTGQCCAH